MDNLLRRKDEIERRLQKLKTQEADAVCKQEMMLEKIQAKEIAYQDSIGVVRDLRSRYKEKREKYRRMKQLLETLKEASKEKLEHKCAQEHSDAVRRINDLVFEPRISVFKAFEGLRKVNVDMFPNLSRHKAELEIRQKNLLRTHLIKELRAAMPSESRIADLIFTINFILRYESFFNETLFSSILFRDIQKEFTYHFHSDRETNRLDKPEWMFSFLLEKYEKAAHLYEIYTECAEESGIDVKPLTSIIERTYDLVYRKITELADTESRQKHKLVLHFGTEFAKFNSEVARRYKFSFNTLDIGHLLHKIEMEVLDSRLAAIHDLRYVQWFPAYRDLCSQVMLYIVKYGGLDKSFSLRDLVDPILLHMKAFIDNLRFLDREEIRVVCHLFSALEEFKGFVSDEETRLKLAFNEVPDDFAEESLELIHKTNASVLRLIEQLSIADIDDTLKTIDYFPYASKEARRKCVVDVYKMVEDYKYCVCHAIILKRMRSRADKHLLDSILLGIRLSDSELEDFESLLGNLKGALGGADWECDKCLETIRGMHSGKPIRSKYDQKIKELYGLFDSQK